MWRMTLPDTVLLIVYALAAARLTGLITLDAITEDARHAVIGWLDDRPKTLGSFLATLIECPWCAGMWIALIGSPMVWFWGASPFMLIPALALAFSQVTGMISNLGR
jgi:hypothetical protein